MKQTQKLQSVRSALNQHKIIHKRLQDAHKQYFGKKRRMVGRKIILGVACYNNTLRLCECGQLGGKESIFAKQCVCSEKRYKKLKPIKDKHNGFTPLNESNINFIYQCIHDSMIKYPAINALFVKGKLDIPFCEKFSDINEKVFNCTGL